MISSMSSPKKAISVILPQVASAEREKMKNSEDIYVTKEGKYFISKRELSVEELDSFIFNLSGNKSMTVFVYGDEETEYNHIDTITKLLYKNRLQKCLFVTKKKER
jgi:biopolymer transport protein ExbD